ncbi:MAG: hypothetical protein ACREE6_07510 [Limisphaerales bacterium]
MPAAKGFAANLPLVSGANLNGRQLGIRAPPEYLFISQDGLLQQKDKALFSQLRDFEKAFHEFFHKSYSHYQAFITGTNYVKAISNRLNAVLGVTEAPERDGQKPRLFLFPANALQAEALVV